MHRQEFCPFRVLSFSVLILTGIFFGVSCNPNSPNEGREVLISSKFESGNEGWKVANTKGNVFTPSHQDHFLSQEDPQEYSTWYWQAPKKFLGNKGAAYGGVLSFVLRQSKKTNQFDKNDVIIEGGGVTLVYEISSHPGTDWSSYDIPLIETEGWTIKGSKQSPSPAQMRKVLSNLQRLWIRGEYHTGDDTGEIDSVVLLRNEDTRPVESKESDE